MAPIMATKMIDCELFLNVTEAKGGITLSFWQLSQLTPSTFLRTIGQVQLAIAERWAMPSLASEQVIFFWYEHERGSSTHSWVSAILDSLNLVFVKFGVIW